MVALMNTSYLNYFSCFGIVNLYVLDICLSFRCVTVERQSSIKFSTSRR